MSIKQILLTSLISIILFIILVRILLFHQLGVALISIILFIILEIIILLWLYSIGVLHIICYIILGSSLSGGMGFPGMLGLGSMYI